MSNIEGYGHDAAEQQAAAQKRRCPDDGACHHNCGDGPCFRVLCCEPLSGVFEGDRWPT